MEPQSSSFSTAKTLVSIVTYFLLFLAGDLVNSIVFDQLFSLVKFQNASFYVILRMLGCTFVTAFLFWLYTNKALHLKMSDFKITWNIRGWSVLLSVLLPVFVVTAFLVIGKAETHLSAPGESVFIIIASIITALKAGVLEEMLFRGFIMTLLERKWNQYAAILAPSLLFGLAHIPSMEYFTIAGVLLLEPVFTAEDAVWPRDFSVRQGEFSPEYFVYCKKIQRSMAEKDPARRRLRL